MDDDVRLILGDCLDAMAGIADGSIDLIAADLPYGTTQCRWDQVIPLEPMWAHFRRLLKPRGAVVLTASQPFTSMLVMSNREWFRFDDVWDKARTTGFLDAKRRPLRRHESVLLFSPSGGFTYNPQMRRGEMAWKGGCRTGRRDRDVQAYGKCAAGPTKIKNDLYYPTSVIAISAGSKYHLLHPNQKPVALFEYLIRTYSNEGEAVLDPTMGSGTTGVAARNTGRKFIGIERDPDYFAVARRRIAEARRCDDSAA